VRTASILRVRRILVNACSLTALALSDPAIAIAQNTPTPPPTASDDNGDADDPTVIVVIGDRSIITSLKNVPVEQVYDRQDIDSYGASTVGEVLGEIHDENGDADPALLVNGQPVSDAGNISDIPVEAIARIEALPRGSAQRVNGAPGQRAYNVVLRSSVKSATLTASREKATEGGWSNNKGEALLNYIKGQDRIGLTFRAARSGTLFESERDFTPLAPTTPYSSIGNIIPFSGTEVDPLLSSLAGHPVNVVALPEDDANPTLAELVASANQTNPSHQSMFRSLRGASRPYEIALAGNKILASWLTLQVNGRVTWNWNQNFSGLPSARFLIPATNPFTPFSMPVYIALNDPDRPLKSTSSGNTQSLSSALNATFGEWRATLSGRWDRRQQHYVSELTGPLTGTLGTVDPATNPFDGSLPASIPVSQRESRSRSSLLQFAADAEGPLINAWAGPIRGRIGGSVSWVDYDKRDSTGPRSLSRHEYLGKVGVSIPLTDRQAGFLPMLGDSQLSFDLGRVDLGRFGTLTRRSASFDWQPIDWLHFVASLVRDERAIAVELLAAPEVINVNVPYFDPLTGQTVDVTTIYGGAAGLKNEDLRTRTLAITASPWKKYRLQIDAEYIVDNLRNQIGALPLPTPAVVAAFPDRFVRDLSGTLILVDTRSVNFARLNSERVRVAARFVVPLTSERIIPASGSSGRRRVLGWRLQANATHTYYLSNRTVIRKGLPEIDLLEGGAIGVGSGYPRHATTASVAVMRGATGIRFDLGRRGKTFLASGTPADPDVLTFHPLTTIDAKLIADLGQLFPKGQVAKGARFTLSVDNIANNRQRVTNSAGEIPQAYQPVRRDPIGRTIQVELRKVF
jgi:hypothetical protein